MESPKNDKNKLQKKNIFLKNIWKSLKSIFNMFIAMFNQHNEIKELIDTLTMKTK